MAFHKLLCTLLISVTLHRFSNAASNCPLLGPVFPKPQNLASSSIMQDAFKNFTSILSGIDSAAEGRQNSYSLEIFSAIDAKSVFTYYHTAANLASFNSTGVKKADGNSVYRIGSLTKLFTMYTFLIEAGDLHFNAPITDYVPELKEIAANKSGDATTRVSWDDITIGALASHMAGIAADNSLMGELTQSVPNINDLIYMGFPPIPSADIPQCGTWPECDRAQFFSTFSHMQPAFAPFSTAAYSNVAFQIISYALETITGKKYENMLADSVINKLGLSNTFYNAPSETLGIIPGTADGTHWYYSLGEENPAGNMYSSSSDIAKFGRAILSYQLLPGPQTRRWMKPMEHSSDIQGSIGAPWGVRRIPLTQKYRIVDAYDKGGQISSWTSFLTLLPDYDVGFILLIAGNNLNGLEMQFLDLWGTTIIPALEATARDQAGKLYAGNYTDLSFDTSSPSPVSSTARASSTASPSVPISNGTSPTTATVSSSPLANGTLGTNIAPFDFLIVNDTLAGAVPPVNSTTRNGTFNGPMQAGPKASLNSSMSIVIDDKPGLGVTHWISNGTDMRLTIAQLMTNYSNPYWVDLSIRLYPTDLVVATDGSKKQSFKAIFEDLGAATVDKTYSTGCASWIGPTAYVYGQLALDQFFFITNSTGSVTIQPQALRATLQRSSGT